MFKLTYGLFVLSTNLNGRDNGCIINTAVQAASEPNTISVAVSKANFTHDLLMSADTFTVSVISQDADFELFKRFGFQSGRTADKFAGLNEVERTDAGTLAVTKGTNAYISALVRQRIDLGSHTLFLGTVTDGKILSDVPSVTYGYYQENIKPKPQKRVENGKTIWRCTVCGYEWEGDELPPDFICPVCKHPASDFEKVVHAEQNAAMNIGQPETKASVKEEKKMKYVCPVCGYVYEGDNPPAECPVCHVPGDKFIVQGEDKTWAAEHVIGVGKQFPADIPEEVKAEIISGLKANFEGECTEVGMYLAMGRAAAREGYPEIAEYWKTAAFEEAEHAAKFAELLGEVVSPSTKENLAVRVEAENGATAGKTALAKLAKQYNLDAIHDTVHEMARDEARHGKAFEGLLKRYFK